MHNRSNDREKEEESENPTRDFEVNAWVHWQRKRQESEWIKLDTSVTAFDAVNTGLELTMEQVNNDGLVPQQVVLPRLLRHHFIWPTIAVFQLNVRFIMDPKDKTNQFSGIRKLKNT